MAEEDENLSPSANPNSCHWLRPPLCGPAVSFPAYLSWRPLLVSSPECFTVRFSFMLRGEAVTVAPSKLSRSHRGAVTGGCVAGGGGSLAPASAASGQGPTNLPDGSGHENTKNGLDTSQIERNTRLKSK